MEGSKEATVESKANQNEKYESRRIGRTTPRKLEKMRIKFRTGPRSRGISNNVRIQSRRKQSLGYNLSARYNTGSEPITHQA